MTRVPTVPLVRARRGRPPTPAARARRRTAAAWTRIAIGLLALLVPLGIVLGDKDAARNAGTASLKAVVAQVVGGLAAEHDAGRTWPSSLVLIGTGVIDADTGRRVATVPAGTALDYERSVDGTRFVVQLSAAGASAAFDSAHPAG